MKKQTIDYIDFAKELAKFETQSFKLDIWYNKADSRCWTALLNQGTDNVLVTYHINKDHLGHECFDVLSSEKTLLGIEPEFIYDTLDTILTQTEQ